MGQRIRLILSDIDGTIMPRGHQTVSPRVIAAFHAALDAGIVIGPCSGRGLPQIPPFFGGDAACCATAIATNGMEIFHGGKKICERTLPRTALERMLELVRTAPHAGLVVFEGAQPHIVCGTREDLLACAASYGHQADTVAGLPDYPIIKANVFVVADLDQTQRLARELAESVPELEVDVPMPGFANLMPAGWNKGAAVRALCEHLGVGLDETVVFGDAENDISMFRVAGHPVAVANATPEAAAAARWHIGACADDAVAAAIEALARGAWPFEG